MDADKEESVRDVCIVYLSFLFEISVQMWIYRFCLKSRQLTPDLPS